MAATVDPHGTVGEAHHSFRYLNHEGFHVKGGLTNMRRTLVYWTVAFVLTPATILGFGGSWSAAAAWIGAAASITAIITQLRSFSLEIRPTDEVLDRTGQQLRREARDRSRRWIREAVPHHGLIDLTVDQSIQLVRDPLIESVPADIDTIEDAFSRADGRLLIIGEAGAGKSTIAHRLCLNLAKNSPAPPVLVNLSAWDGHRTFSKFLVDYLSKYGINAQDGAQWLRHRDFALVLDGLDEVPPPSRDGLLSSLSKWNWTHLPLVITCRTDEYKDIAHLIHADLALGVTVEIQPLDDSQLDLVLHELQLRSGSNGWSALAEPSYGNASTDAVREALRSPLMINLAVGSGIDPSELELAGSSGVGNVKSSIIDTYIKSVTSSRRDLGLWARWIARYLLGDVTHVSLVHPEDATVFDPSRVIPWGAPLRWAASLAVVLAGVLVAVFLMLEVSAWVAIASTLGICFITVFARVASPNAFAVEWSRRDVPYASAFCVGIGATVLGWLANWPPNAHEATAWLTFGAGVLLFLRGILIFPSRPTGSHLRYPWWRARRGVMYAMLTAVAFNTWLFVGWTLATLAGDVRLDSLLGFATDTIPTVMSELIYPFLSLTVVWMTIFALNAGGWFIIYQWYVWRSLRRYHKVATNALGPISAEVSAPPRGRLPMFRAVGPAVRFIHDDVRDRMAQFSDLDTS